MTTRPPSTPAVSGEGVDVRYYAGLVWRGRYVILAAAVVGLALGALAAFLQTPEYRASAMLQIEPPTPTFMTVTDALVGGGNYWQNADFYNTQFKVLRSTGLGDKVVEKLGLGGRAPFQGHPSPGALFMGHVTVEPVPESRLVLVQVTLPDPQEAARWANTLAEVYVEQTLSTRVEAARRAYEWLQERLGATQKSMREAQGRLFENYQTQDLFVPEGGVSAVATSIAKLNDDYIDAQGRRITVEAALKQVDQMQSRGESLETVPQIAADLTFLGLSTQLATLNLEMTRLRERFKEGHPEVQKVQAQIDQVRKVRDERAAQLASGLRAELNQLVRRESEIKAAIDAQKVQAATQSRKGAELEALRKEAESSKNLYEVLLQKLNETDIAASIRSNNVTVIERAAPPSSPVRPNKPRVAGIGLLFGLALGVAFVLGRDYLENTIKDPEELERYLHVDLLAAVPRYDESSVHFVTEAYQNLRTALIFGRKDERGQIVLVTGTAPQEGKTTTLVNIAKLLAASGEKTLVVDCDLRRAQVHQRLGLTREPGLTDHFTRHEPIEALVKSTRVPNLFVLTAGPLPPNPPALLARKEMEHVLDRAREHFEWVIVDTPPLASVTDALLLARHADMTLFVVQHNKIDKKLIKRTVGSLRKMGANVLGVVLNAVDVKARTSYYYYYHQQETADAAEAPEREPAEEKVAAGSE